MIRLLAVAALMVAAPAWAGGLWRVEVHPGQVRCSARPAPATTPVAASPGDNLQTKIGTACGSGPGIVELAAGTYSDQNVMLGTDGVLVGASIGGTCVVRAANPASKPLIRAAIGTNRAIFQIMNVTQEVRFENLKLDGRRSEQTNAVISACRDTDENAGAGNGICDASDYQNRTNAHGIWSRITSTGTAKLCALNVEVQEVVGDAITLRDQVDSTVEGAVTDGAGCDPTTCPLLTVPADYNTHSLLVVGRGTNFIDSTRVMAVDGHYSHATKQGGQCYNSTECYLLDNVATHIGLSGMTMLGSSGVVMGNTVQDVGTDWAHNTAADNTGGGIDVTAEQSATFSVRISGNTIARTWGDALQVGLAASVSPAPTAIVERNAITDPCTGRISSTSAGLTLGDQTYPFASIASRSNSVTGSKCASGVRVSRPGAYVGVGTTISGSVSGKGVVFDHASIAESSLVTDKNVEIDANSSGTISGCTLNGGATVSDASSGAVVRSGGC